MSLKMFETWAMTALWLGHPLWCAGLGLWLLWGAPVRETLLRRCVKTVSMLSLGLSVVIAVTFFAQSQALELIDLGQWFGVGEFHYLMQVEVDRVAAVCLVVFSVLLLVMAEFATNYLHRDPGFPRFMLLFSLLQMAMVIVTSADQFELLLLGWELMGVASYLLIGFFREYAAAGVQSARALVHYKIADVGLVLAVVLLLDLSEHLHFTSLAGFVQGIVASGHTAKLQLIGFLLIFGSLGKSGQLPFFGWLPRAMEGPTASTAIFYGALSVHMGPLLLLKAEPLWAWSPALRLFMGAVGLCTAVLAATTAKTVANMKAQYAYLVMAELGFIYIELAAGWYTLALLHICCHAALRTLQFIRSPSILQDIAEYPEIRQRGYWQFWQRLLGKAGAERLYVHAYNGFYVDILAIRLVAAPVEAVGRWILLVLNYLVGLMPLRRLR